MLMQYHLYIDGSDIPIKQLQKDLGVLISSDLTWTSHISYITAKAYKILGLLRWTFGSSHNPMAMKKLYLTLVRSQYRYLIIHQFGGLTYQKTYFYYSKKIYKIYIK